MVFSRLEMIEQSLFDTKRQMGVLENKPQRQIEQITRVEHKTPEINEKIDTFRGLKKDEFNNWKRDLEDVITRKI